MYQDLSLYTVAVIALFSVNLVSADDRSLYKEIHNDEKRFSTLDEATDNMPYTDNYWYYPHTTRNFLQTLLHYLALNEQSYRNTVKRQRTFGFMANRGKRGDVDDLMAYLRKLQDDVSRRRKEQNVQSSMFDTQNDDFLKNKRQPHFGFHGMRG